MRFIPALCTSVLFALPCPAAVVVLTNGTTKPVTCTVALGTAAAVNVTLAVRESKPITCGRTIIVGYTNAEGPQLRTLEPWAAYVFGEKDKIGLDLRGIPLAGKSPGIADVPEAVPEVKKLKVPVKILVDDADRRTKLLWTTSLKKRLTRANEVLEKAAGVVFEVAEEEEWKADAAVTDLKSILVDFEMQVKPDPAVLAIGYTSRGFVNAGGQLRFDGFAINRPPLHPHMLIRETDPRNEPERVEVLVAQLGRYLGAVTSPDEFSAMRMHLGDGKAVLAKFDIAFDPLNTLAMNIWADAMRAGPLKGFNDFKPEMLARLARVYGTLHAAVPEEPLSEPVAALLEKAALRVAAEELVAPPPKKDGAPGAVEPPKKAERAITADQEAIRKVVRGVVVVAEENSRKPAAGRLKGDELTNLYIRTAADIAYTLEPKLRKQAFLYGIGIALDDSTVMRDKPIIGDTCKAVESDDERKLRIAVLGNPTIRYRRDLCQHFVISAALTEFGGAMIAEQVGLLKEQKDMQGTSGFSFSDLCADFAGIEFATLVKSSGETLNDIRQKFTTNDYVPKLDDLPDGLSKEKFKLNYGDTADARFKKEYDDVKQRVKELKAYQKQ